MMVMVLIIAINFKLKLESDGSIHFFLFDVRVCDRLTGSGCCFLPLGPK